MKKTIIAISALFVSMTLFAERVSQEDAALVANNFMNPASTNVNLKKAVPAKRMVLKQSASTEQPQYYIYENANGEGWVLVAANDAVTPILAYSETGHFCNSNNMPENLKHWMGLYNDFIKRIEDDNVEASEEAVAEWNHLRKSPPSTPKGNVVVAPLIKTTWDQCAPFDLYTPGTGQYGEGNTKAATGCVATAMAQVMNYWQWPIHGKGSREYKPLNPNTFKSQTKYGKQSADFEATTYDWANMLNAYTDEDGYELPGLTTAQKQAVATLMYHCGVATRMMYGDYAWGGSGAMTVNWCDWNWPESDGDCAQNAFYNFFRYKKPTGYYRKGDGGDCYNSWTDAKWTEMIKAELDKKHPIMYAGGDSNSGGHSFICDGYDDYQNSSNGNYFHFNWGWSGMSDGWYRLSSLKPGTGGAGGGSYDFTADQDVIIGIEPDGKPTAYEQVVATEIKADKVIENGQLIIIRNNEKYSVLGHKIQ